MPLIRFKILLLRSHTLLPAVTAALLEVFQEGLFNNGLQLCHRDIITILLHNHIATGPRHKLVRYLILLVNFLYISHIIIVFE